MINKDNYIKKDRAFLLALSFCFMCTQIHAVSEFVQVEKTIHEKIMQKTSNVSEFVHEKKIKHEKSSKIKEEIVETLESLLTRSSDMIASIAQEQHLIVQKVREVAQGECAFEQKSPHELKKYRDSLKKMEEDFEKQTQHIHRQFAQLKKDFSHT